ncbi:hypothetical protein FIBSPDRAFT_892293 [Athelia psychrophila]|uniref:Uncharacterized protein n=1 Tax=Athelia psychrophila TaxID=1759441 RepID=A0A166IJU1_9AGAM|nr:hypothetical protein FIBSPDRAFT_892293 [Fibularhizoctonia sp. CBS 109695]
MALPLMLGRWPNHCLDLDASAESSPISAVRMPTFQPSHHIWIRLGCCCSSRLIIAGALGTDASAESSHTISSSFGRSISYVNSAGRDISSCHIVYFTEPCGLVREKEMCDSKEELEREKRRKEVFEKEREKAELEKKELKLARIKLQLQEKETKDLADADRKKDTEAKAVAELTQPFMMPPPPTSPLKIDPICREMSSGSGSGSDDQVENVPVLPPPPQQWMPGGDFNGDSGSPI